MGLLSLGTPLAWEDARELSEHVRKHGIEQFLSVWRESRDRQNDPLLWGDELEYMVVVLDHAHKTARLSLRQGEILERLNTCCMKELQNLAPEDRPKFHPEYGRYMIESTPGSPFGISASELLRVEPNMLLRRDITRQHLRDNEVPMALASYPRLGVLDTPFTEPVCELPPRGVASHSLFLPDEIINQHVRFPTLTANIRKRRGSKVRINVPIFRDVHTPTPFIDPSIPWERAEFAEDPEAKLGAAYADHIYMDAMGFGMGCSCLQVTFQARCLADARRMYDQLIPITPLLLAATAASPVYRGYLADVDCRWNIISAAVDDRTPTERAEHPLKPAEPMHNSDTGPRTLRKSRYDSVDSYLNAREWNDVDLEMNMPVKQRLMECGVDELLAEHMAHLFVRDPLVVFSENIDLDDARSMDHFENIQSTNWQTMRFKPPPHGAHVGWRVEFRPMEIQLTDFENAAYSIFLVLLTQVIMTMPVDFCMPISLVDVNMQRAQQRNAVHTQRFHFRTSAKTKEIREYTLAELFLGTPTMPGLVPLTRTYLDSLDLDSDTRRRLDEYLDFVAMRADGRLVTMATFVRDFVTQHHAYQRDSVIHDEINYDLLCVLDAIERGTQEAPTLLPSWYADRRRHAGGM